ncbi:MAG: hypothetical protein HOP34_16350 [Methylococcaceae bacterium]|nr:hypothetical protein [Methylococcaceae bacterium]
MNKTKALLIGVLAFGCNNVQAGLANAGFENGINDWNLSLVNGTGTIVSSSGTTNPALTAAEGSKFLKLTTGSSPALAIPNVNSASYLTQGNWVKEFQPNVSFSAGDIFKFNFAFSPNPLSTSDAARASIFQVLQGGGLTEVFSIILQGGIATQRQLNQFDTIITPTNIAFAPFRSAWQLITVPIYTTGIYKVEFAVANVTNSSGSSSAFFDSYQKVPEASTLSLFALGLLGLAQLKTRKTA